MNEGLEAGSVSDEGPNHVHEVMTDPRITALPVMLSESEDEEDWFTLMSDILKVMENPVSASIEPAIIEGSENACQRKQSTTSPHTYAPNRAKTACRGLRGCIAYGVEKQHTLGRG